MRIDPFSNLRHAGRTDDLAKPAFNREAASPKRLSGSIVEGLMSPPFDADRVAAIRKAIDQGSYPLLPGRMADAIIAARYLLRKP